MMTAAHKRAPVQLLKLRLAFRAEDGLVDEAKTAMTSGGSLKVAIKVPLQANDILQVSQLSFFSVSFSKCLLVCDNTLCSSVPNCSPRKSQGSRVRL